MNRSSDELEQLRVETTRRAVVELRKRLLDLSNRNRLLNYKYGPAVRQVRIVNATLEGLMERLNAGGAIRFASIPQDDGPDAAVENALERARLTDEDYIHAVASADQDADSPKIVKAEERLLEKVCIDLGKPATKPARRTPAEIATAIGIEPSFDLSRTAADGGKILQTLLFPEALERKLSSIRDEAISAVQERGVATLYCALGFLEWFESDDSAKALLSPLLLVPIEMERRVERSNYVYFAKGIGEDTEINVTLQERLYSDFKLTLPSYDPSQPLHEYLRAIQIGIASYKRWTIRSFATVGLFDFTRLAMYRDLDPAKRPAGSALEDHATLKDILGGVIERNASSSERDYSSDALHPSAPLLITDADSSQFAAILDAMDGSSFVIEGPPGTGKSQTITNIISALLNAGKTVLFLADKLAALEVVKARLDAASLGDFCMELHSTKLQKSEVYAALDRRLRATSKASPQATLFSALNDNKLLIERYSEELHKFQGSLGQSLYDLMWRSQVLKLRLGEAAAVLHTLDFEHVEELTPSTLSELKTLALATHDRLRTYNAEYGSVRFHPLAPIVTPSLNQRDLVLLRDLLKEVGSTARRIPQMLLDIGIDEDDVTYGFAKQIASTFRALRDIQPTPTLADVQRAGTLTHSEDLANIVSDCLLLKRRSAQWPLALYEEALINNRRCRDVVEFLRANQFSDRNDIRAMLSEANDLATMLGRAADLAATIDRELPWTLRQSQAHLFCLVAVINELRRRDRSTIAGCDGSVLDVPPPDAVDELASDIRRVSEALGEMGKEYDLYLSPAPTIVRGFAATLRQANFFTSLFSTNVRNARRFYRGLAFNNDNKTATNMAEHLVRLAETLEARDSLEESATYRTLFGERFRGISTDLTTLYRLAQVGESLRTVLREHGDAGEDIWRRVSTLDSAQVTGLRDLGSAADTAFLENVYRSLAPGTILTDGLATAEGSAAFCKQLLLLLDSIHAPEGTSVTTLSQVVDDAEAANDLNARIASNKEHSEYLQGSRTAEDIELKLAAIHYCGALVASNLGDVVGNIEPSDIAKSVHANDLILGVAFLTDRLQKLEVVASIDINAFVRGSLDDAILSALAGRSDEMLSHFSDIQDWSNYLQLRNSAETKGIQAILGSIGELTPADEAVEYVIIRSLISSAMSARPEFASVDGPRLRAAREAFRQLDRRLLLSNQQQLRRLLLKRPVSQGIGVGNRGMWTDRRLIENESGKKTRYISLRDLHTRAGSALQQLKPCYMMSPLSVAQFLEAGKVSFDVLIIDEASQMRPEDALGAISRSRQLIVVGDPKQLPPTSFFDRADGSSDEVTDEDAIETESILGLALQQYGRPRRLLWHYRSRHDSLIAFSNKNFYDNELLVFPSPDRSGDLGVSYRHVDGRYQSGAGTNAVEADRISSRAIEVMKLRGSESLGIVAMNQRQRDLIRLEVDRKLALDREAQKYVEQWEETVEPFIIKNLESIQGDERDNVLISTVYGPDRAGNMFQRFGPINSRFGWRRLNVLFTRAKLRVEVITSMRPHDVLSDERAGRGVRALHDYLDYAASGRLEVGLASEREPESDFEIAVAAMLRNRGFECVPQVGVAGYFIDIGVRDPGNTGKFILGIECDGRSYHSSKAARDRDRLRDEVLSRLGWALHRIWSTDWFADPARELEKVITAISAGEASSAFPELDSPDQPGGERVSSSPQLLSAVRAEQANSPAKPSKVDDLLLESDVLEAMRSILTPGLSLERERLLLSLSSRLNRPLVKATRSTFNKMISREIQAGRLIVDSSWSIVTRP